MEKIIGIFDSGLGGLTAAAEFEKLFENKKYIYFGDTARVPYGTKSSDTICRYAYQDTKFLIEKGASLIIVACGTVSANAIESLKERFDVPIIGVVEPAANKAVEIAKGGNKKIAVLGTAATVKSGAYERAIRYISSEVEVRSVACPMFVPLVENGYTHGEAAVYFANEYLHDLKDYGADAVILGCTHYPHLSDVISDTLRGSVLVNAGEEAVRVASTILKGQDVADGKPEFYVSDAPESFENFARIFMGRESVGNVNCIEIEGY